MPCGKYGHSWTDAKSLAYQTAYPLLALNQNPELFIHCLDYSRQAVSLVQVSIFKPMGPRYRLKGLPYSPRPAEKPSVRPSANRGSRVECV